MAMNEESRLQNEQKMLALNKKYKDQDKKYKKMMKTKKQFYQKQSQEAEVLRQKVLKQREEDAYKKKQEYLVSEQHKIQKEKKIQKDREKYFKTMQKKGEEKDNRIMQTIMESEMKQHEWQMHLDQKNQEADARLVKNRKKQAMEELKHKEKNRLEKDNKHKFMERKQRQQEFMLQVTKDKLTEEAEEFKKFHEKKERLKQKRVKALFDAEGRRQEVRKAMEQMAVWNAFDNDIVTEFIDYEKKCKKTGKIACTVQDYVRRKAVGVHKKEQELQEQIAFDEQ